MLDFLLPPPPSTWSKDATFNIHKTISAPIEKVVEPAGTHFIASVNRKLANRTLSQEERHLQEQLTAKEKEQDEGEAFEEEEEDPALLELDPKEWKHHDLYAILGITKLRYKATDEQIKNAYRRKVLKHHPDKKAASGNVNDDSFYKCIQRAYDILTTRRREYDSVDFGMDESVPSPKAKGDFFKLYGPVFERESRFSNKHPVPQLGDITSTREEVETFYDFWYNFDSWRSFEHLDEEDVESADNREDKRWLEKKNRAARAKRKKEDNARLRSIVDQALSLDPRIKLFKEEDRKRRNAKKNQRAEAERQAAEEKKKKEEEERLAKERAEAEEKEQREKEKKNKELLKRAVRKEKKTIKALMKDHHYFVADLAEGQEPSAIQVEEQLQKLDRLFDRLKTLEELEAVRKRIEEAAPQGTANQVLDEELAKE
ncbi:uncharacterized protein VTP21DRAFT_7963 [Calcarisporiella thermophila]|uniref:uncharacterized protein n=1 Tax=Calcarisporiella thermophila TaxID=911321 RepID=UPI003743998A